MRLRSNSRCPGIAHRRVRENFRRKICLMFFVAAGVAFSLFAQDKEKPLTAAALPEFIAGYEKILDRVDTAYKDLSSSNLPLRDETGQPLGRHHMKDRQKELADLRQLAHQLAAKPQDLILTTRLFIQTEILVDNLFDLSQMSYDNDREEMGNRCSELERAMDRERGLMETYTLTLAAETEKRIQELEKENKDLQQKLRPKERRKAKSHR